MRVWLAISESGNDFVVADILLQLFSLQFLHDVTKEGDRKVPYFYHVRQWHSL